MKWGWGAAKGFALIVVIPVNRLHIIGVGLFNADIGEVKVFKLLAID